MVQKVIRQIGFLLNDAGEVVAEQEPIYLAVGETSDGDDAARTVAEIQQPTGTLEQVVLTINGDADLFTNPAAPVAAELFKVVPTSSDKKHARITMSIQSIPYVQGATSDIPIAAFCVATLNATLDATALTRLTVADNGVGDYTASGLMRVISPQATVIEWDLTGTDSFIEDVFIGGIPPTDTGQIPVYLNVEIW